MANEQIIPRFQGNAVKHGKEWTWELWITVGDTDPLFIDMRGHRSFLNKDAALNDLRADISSIMGDICVAVGLGKPDGVIDLKRNAMISNEEFAKPTVHS